MSPSQRVLLTGKHKVEISTKILDRDGNPFTEDAELAVDMTLKDIKTGTNVNVQPYPLTIIKDGQAKYDLFGSVCAFKIEVKKKGFKSTQLEVKIDRTDADPDEKIEGLKLYVIDEKRPAGKLESVDNGFAVIPVDKENNRLYGWSFKEKWYFPAGEKQVDMTRTTDLSGDDEYTMKGSGGFIPFRDYLIHSDRPHINVPNMELMGKAPEMGYVSTIIPKKDKARYSINCSPCYYFRTPEGKYGKIEFVENGRFRYRIQPDGSTYLFTLESKYKYAVR